MSGEEIVGPAASSGPAARRCHPGAGVSADISSAQKRACGSGADFNRCSGRAHLVATGGAGRAGLRGLEARCSSEDVLPGERL